MNYPLVPEVVDIARHGTALVDGTHALRMRSFTLLYSEIDGPLSVVSDDEYFVLLPRSSAELHWQGGVVHASPRSVVIMPPGPSEVRLVKGGTCVRLFATLPEALRGIETFGNQLPAVPLRPMRPYYRISPLDQPVVHVLDELPNPVGMPRAKLLQTSTMSINWVEYSGARDRKNLSPHSHPDFEQASLALAGEFVHHFRVPWENDADTWQEDQHLPAGPGTVALIPPGIIHTTEGVGPGSHILIDIFAPPREDFIAKGQILNAGAYTGVAGSTQ